MTGVDKFFTEAVSETLKKFKKHTNRIIRANQTKDYKKRTQYLLEAIDTYNIFIAEVNKYFIRLGYDDKTTARAHFLEFKGYILKYLGAYNINNFPEPTDGYKEIEIEEAELEALVQTGLVANSTPDSTDDESNTNNNTMTGGAGTSGGGDNSSNAAFEFLNKCSKYFTEDFDGKFENLRPFINKIQTLQIFATTAEQKKILKQCVISKLGHTALSKVDKNANTVEDIINSLQSKILHESPKEIEGRMAALSLDKKPLTEFHKNAVKLAEQYQLALVQKGIDLAVAEEMTIEKTVDLCRRNTKLMEVKAILSATKFSTPNEVVSKMVTQIDAVKLDKLTTENSRSEDKNKNKNGGHNNRNNRGRGGRNNREHQNNENGNNPNGNHRGGNSGHSARGRGRGRGGHGGNSRGGHGDGSQFYRNEQNAYVVSGNGPTPQQGAPQQTQ